MLRGSQSYENDSQFSDESGASSTHAAETSRQVEDLSEGGTRNEGSVRSHSQTESSSGFSFAQDSALGLSSASRASQTSILSSAGVSFADDANDHLTGATTKGDMFETSFLGGDLDKSSQNEGFESFADFSDHNFQSTDPTQDQPLAKAKEEQEIDGADNSESVAAPQEGKNESEKLEVCTKNEQRMRD